MRPIFPPCRFDDRNGRLPTRLSGCHPGIGVSNHLRSGAELDTALSLSKGGWWAPPAASWFDRLTTRVHASTRVEARRRQGRAGSDPSRRVSRSIERLEARGLTPSGKEET